MAKIFVVPDVQAKPGVPLEHLEWAGNAICRYRPDHVLILGDFADLESLSSYASRREAEGRRYSDDIEIAWGARDTLMGPIRQKWGKKLQRPGAPKFTLLYGNHEARITRAVEENPHLEGILSLDQLGYADAGWETHPFLEIVNIEGVGASHYFQQPGTSRAVTGMIETRIKNIGFPFVQGHQQGLKTGMVARNNGELIRGIVAGSFYLHTESYTGQTDSAYWRGCLVLNDVRRGQYDLMELSMDYLCREFGPGVHVWEHMTKNYRKLSAHSPWVAQERLSRTGR